ncbi:MAG: YdcF family protein [Chitinophagaceae bacterium]|nr:YdcF family protein [Chitinophagaceae bacterium]
MFIIGKLFTALLNPVLWIVLLFLWGLLAKKEKRKKRCFVAGVVMLLFFSNPFIIQRFTLAYQAKKYSLNKDEVYSAGILLGGFAGMNESDRQVYYGEASDRFIQTAELYKTGHIHKIIIAAGSGSIFQDKSFREADFAQEQLINLCIPPGDVFADRDSKNTAENAANAKKIIDSLQLKPPYLLITSAVHMPRAVRTFTKAGLIVKPFPAAFAVVPPSGFDLEDYIIPSAAAFKNWHVFLKEMVGTAAYKITGRG